MTTSVRDEVAKGAAITDRPRRPVVIGPPTHVLKPCVDCGKEWWVEKNEYSDPFRCTRCEDKRKINVEKSRLRRIRYQKAKAKMLKRNPNWPGKKEEK